jgi:hypothetical protein
MAFGAYTESPRLEDSVKRKPHLKALSMAEISALKSHAKIHVEKFHFGRVSRSAEHSN